MLESIVIGIIYLSFLLIVVKLSGVKYTEMLRSTDNIKNGLLIPLLMGTLVLTAVGLGFGWIPGVFNFTPRLDSWLLWLVLAVFIARILVSFAQADYSRFTVKGLIYLILGTAMVGYTEELLVRGIMVELIRQDISSLIPLGLVSSALFGVMHFMNYFNGQSLQTTSVQVVATFLMGFSFFTLYVISGTLWLPIIIHWLFDLSTMVASGDIDAERANTPSKLLSILGLVSFAIACYALVVMIFIT